MNMHGSDSDAVPIRNRAEDLDRRSYLLLLRKILDERLTQKQKYILHYVHKNPEARSVTFLVKIISSDLDCSESAVWDNVRSLKRCGILETNNGIKLNSRVTLILEGGDNDG